VHGGAIAGHGSSPELRLAWPMVTGLGRGELKTKRRWRGSSPKSSQQRVILVESSRQRCFLFMVHRSWEASLVANSCLGVLKLHHRVHAVLHKVLTGLGKPCAAAVAMELELDSSDGEKLLWWRWEGSFIGLGVWVGEVQCPESKSQLNRGFP
jgi:hypothetical protein